MFVLGAESAIEPSVLARNGVTVYDSVANSTDAATTDMVVDNDYTFKETDIFSFINRVRAARSGIASTTITSTVRGVVADGEDMTSGFVLDGFGITNDADRLTSTPVVLNDDKTLLRNCIVYNNHVEGDKPVVSINKGLLYNSLLYGNDAPTVVNVVSGATGGVLNSTVVAEAEGQTAIRSSEADKVVNAVTYNKATRTVSGAGTFAFSNTKTGMFAPYLNTSANAYSYPFGTQEPLWYQLHENSECIDGGTNDWSSYFDSYSTLWEGLTGNATDGYVPGYSDHTAQQFIDFTQDCDILGNPRLLFTTVDRSAFETWRIADNTPTAVEVTNATDAAVPGASPSGYGMNVPHLLYKNINDQTGNNDQTGVATDLLKQGQFISARSWVDGSTLELGSAFFTQTAVMADKEELTFKRPLYTGATAPISAKGYASPLCPAVSPPGPPMMMP